MRPSSKMAVMIDQAQTTNAETAHGNVDTRGFDYCEIGVTMATSNAVSNNPTVFDVLEGDTTVVSNFATISGFVGDTDWTIPDAVTTGGWTTKFNIDCRARKRYLALNISPLTTQVITAIAHLHMGDELPKDATSAGVDAVVYG